LWIPQIRHERGGEVDLLRSYLGTPHLGLRVLSLALTGIAACAWQPDLEADRAELLRMHDMAQTAHLEKRADLLVASFADSFLNISRGEVTLRSPAESRTRFQAYLDRSTFQEWADLAPPIIRISPDGQMAYVIVRKRVRLTAPDSAGVTRPEHTIFAWVELYEKRGGKWTLMAVASTDHPGEG
jgi:hypothetical protein